MMMTAVIRVRMHLLRKMAGQYRIQRANEGGDFRGAAVVCGDRGREPGHRSPASMGGYRGPDTDQRAVASMERQRVLNQEQPVAVFAGHGAAVTLIPVVDEILLPILARDIRIDRDITFGIDRETLAPCVDPFPAGSGQAI